MTRLLIATDSFLPRWDGISRFLSEIIPKLSVDFDITVLAPEFEGFFEGYKNINLIRFPVMGFTAGDINPAFPSYNAIRKSVKESDIVFTQTLGTIGGLAVIEAWRQRRTHLAYTHSIEWELYSNSISFNSLRNITYSLTKFYARRLYNRCDLLLVPSREVAEILGRNGIKPPKKVLRLGVDTNRFTPSKDKAASKEAIGISGDAKVIGYCGRIAREKDLLTLLRAFIRVKKKIPNAVLLIIGGGRDEIINQLQDREDVILTGPRDKAEKYYKAMDVYVLPSLTETTSLTTLEAMSSGVPPISTRVGFTKEYITNEHSGFFYPKKNSFVLFNLLEKLLLNNHLRERMGKTARNTVMENFSWDKTIDEIENVIKLY